MTIRGSCLCGAVSYEITGSFKVMGNCHCSICRKSHGAAFATWGIIDPDQFRWTSGETFVQAYESSPGRQRGFCQKCGTPLVSLHFGEVGEVVVGTVDDDPGMRPSEHIFVASKAPWHEISDTLPQFDEWPPEIDSSLTLEVR
ncbi:MAG: GFA family protein [Leptolyngbya sp. SIO4C1]|nr:GFA family protein [Leptolyngbya sp. SIO4C1]